MGLESLIMLVVGILVALLVAGVLAYLVRSAPFIPEPMKSAVVWVIWAVLAIFFLLWVVRALGGHGGGW